jgi:hypothetical protein
LIVPTSHILVAGAIIMRYFLPEQFLGTINLSYYIYFTEKAHVAYKGQKASACGKNNKKDIHVHLLSQGTNFTVCNHFQ